ncbi:MAG TPA: hypothetical protein DCW68_00965 [Rhodospirillaceae bacterium]|nr:hypothetical protein [Rhodospirillaceae bacterium]
MAYSFLANNSLTKKMLRYTRPNTRCQRNLLEKAKKPPKIQQAPFVSFPAGIKNPKKIRSPFLRQKA